MLARLRHARRLAGGPARSAIGAGRLGTRAARGRGWARRGCVLQAAGATVVPAPRGVAVLLLLGEKADQLALIARMAAAAAALFAGRPSACRARSARSVTVGPICGGPLAAAREPRGQQGGLLGRMATQPGVAAARRARAPHLGRLPERQARGHRGAARAWPRGAARAGVLLSAQHVPPRRAGRAGLCVRRAALPQLRAGVLLVAGLAAAAAAASRSACPGPDRVRRRSRPPAACSSPACSLAGRAAGLLPAYIRARARARGGRPGGALGRAARRGGRGRQARRGCRQLRLGAAQLRVQRLQPRLGLLRERPRRWRLCEWDV